jgi:hypothetical protein
MQGGPAKLPRSLPEEVLAMPGRSILASLRALAGVLRILHANMRDLLGWIDRTNDPEVLGQV